MKRRPANAEYNALAAAARRYRGAGPASPRLRNAKPATQAEIDAIKAAQLQNAREDSTRALLASESEKQTG